MCTLVGGFLLHLSSCPRYLDKLLNGSLLAKKDIPKVTQASEEAARVKRLMGALRYLFRNSALTYFGKTHKKSNLSEVYWEEVGLELIFHPKKNP